MSPSLEELTNPDPEASISPVSAFVMVVVVTVLVVVSTVVIPLASLKLSVTVSDTTLSITDGSHKPTVLVGQIETSAITL
tara:strand:- start:779 stop:1018 length:240 start_codon:yes stop_codon:yes gene_type:complete